MKEVLEYSAIVIGIACWISILWWVVIDPIIKKWRKK